jgi:hypothetical protein
MPAWLSRIGHGQRELRQLHRILPSGEMAAAALPEHHPHRRHEQDHSARGRQRPDRDVRQKARGSSPSTMRATATVAAVTIISGCTLLLVAGLREAGISHGRDQRELGPNADQRHRERVDRTGSGDRCLVHRRSVAEMKSVLPGLPGNQPARGARERTDVHDPWQKTPGPLLAILSD